MGSFSNYLENKWMNHVLEGTAFTVPTTVALALSTADPTDDGSGIAEPVGSNYSRTSCKANFATAAATRIISNDGIITCPTASGSWGTISHWALFDNTVGGNMLAHGSFSASKAVASGQTPKVLVGEIDISIPAANGMTDYLANEMLDHTFLNGDGGFAQPTVYMALSVTTAFGDSGVWTNEVSTSGTAYARIATAWTVSGNAAANNGALTFAVATASWGSPNSWALADGDTEGAGNMLLYHAKDFGAIAADDQINIPDGDLDITLD